MISIDDLMTDRTPADRLTCSWGMLANLGSTVGGAASTAGTAIGNAATGVAQNSGLSSLYNAGSSLLSGGGEAGYLQSLGQQVPQGVEMAGPMGQGGFWQGLQQGFQGVMGGQQGPSVGNQFGQGLGMLGNFLDQGRGGGGQMNAGQLLRSALSQYGIEPRAAVQNRGGITTQPQGGLLSLHIGGSTGVG